MFGDANAISWSDFFGGSGGNPDESGTLNPAPGDLPNAIPPAGAIDTAQLAGGTAADTRNVSELQARIKASGGKLTAAANSSDYIVAINNRLRFSVTRDASGQFVITESQSYLWLIGLAVVGGIVILASR